MTDQERAVMQQALEALEKSGCVAFKGLACRCNSTCASYTAAVALRAALAQKPEPVPTHRINSWGFCGVCRHDRILGEGCARQECPDSPQQPEPVNVAGLSIAAQSTIGRWLNEDMDRAVANGANSISMPDELVEIAAWLHALAEPAQQPEPAQEPVAWAFKHSDGTYHDPSATEHSAGMVPLGPIRAQRPPLTDEEIDKATAQERDALLDHIYEHGTTAGGVLRRIRRLCRAIERKVRGE